MVPRKQTKRSQNAPTKETSKGLRTEPERSPEIHRTERTAAAQQTLAQKKSARVANTDIRCSLGQNKNTVCRRITRLERAGRTNRRNMNHRANPATETTRTLETQRSQVETGHQKQLDETTECAEEAKHRETKHRQTKR